MTPHAKAMRGLALLEVLVTIIIVAVGLLGLAGVQARMHVAEMEAYQRTQASILLQSMTDRLNANRTDAMSYVTASALGAGNTLRDCSALDGAALDHCEWSNALLGAAETSRGQSVGAMIGARGCIENLDPALPQRFRITVAWQGLSPTVSPESTCGEGAYGDDRTRRAIVSLVTIACLRSDPVTGACVPP